MMTKINGVLIWLKRDNWCEAQFGIRWKHGNFIIIVLYFLIFWIQILKF